MRPAFFAIASALVGCGSDITISEGDEAPIAESVCDGRKQADEEYVDAPYDRDGDGFFDGQNIDCQATYEELDLDCNDADPDAHPAAFEETCNGVDDDCDPSTPDRAEEEIACNGVDDDCNPNTQDAPDLDYDGFDACSDCDDLEPDAAPGLDEVCDDGIDNDCDDEIDEDCASDWSGTWSLEGPVSYSCAFGLVNIAFSQVYTVHADPTIQVSSVGGSQPGTMAGTVTEDTFTASNVLSGACTESYTISGTFTGPETFEATFEAGFSGAYCYDCAPQSWTIYGHRASR